MIIIVIFYIKLNNNFYYFECILLYLSNTDLYKLSFNSPDTMGNSPFYYLLEQNRYIMLEILFNRFKQNYEKEFIGNNNFTKKLKQNALHIIAKNNSIDCFIFYETYIKKYLNHLLSEENQYGRLPIHYCVGNNVSLFRKFLNANDWTLKKSYSMLFGSKQVFVFIIML